MFRNMKFAKSIGLLVVYPVFMLMIGIFLGAGASSLFSSTEQLNAESSIQDLENNNNKEESNQAVAEAEADIEKINALESSEIVAESLPVSSLEETLCVDTEYILKEMDIVKNTVVETIWKIPDMYVGMNREQFLTAMENYAAFPPLSELERGFVGLEVLSFSRERVIIQMNYQYLEPSTSFYLAVLDNEVVVYLEDKETIYINTGILLDSLPQNVQMEIIQMMWVKDEESLYDFLETYSS